MVGVISAVLGGPVLLLSYFVAYQSTSWFVVAHAVLGNAVLLLAFFFFAPGCLRGTFCYLRLHAHVFRPLRWRLSTGKRAENLYWLLEWLQGMDLCRGTGTSGKQNCKGRPRSWLRFLLFGRERLTLVNFVFGCGKKVRRLDVFEDSTRRVVRTVESGRR